MSLYYKNKFEDRTAPAVNSSIRRKLYRSKKNIFVRVEESLIPTHDDVETSSVIGEPQNADDLDWDISSISDSEDGDRLLFTDCSTSEDTSCSDIDEADPIETDSPMSTYCGLTRKDSLSLVSAFATRHTLTKTATADLLQLIKQHLLNPQIYPSTYHKFEKLLKLDFSWIERKYLCISCLYPLNSDLVCGLCKSVHILKVLKQKNSYFLVFNVRRQLECLLRNIRVTAALNNFFSSPKLLNCFSDITSGQKYAKIKKQPFDLTCTFNTDGVPVFKSSNSSIWPVLISINELPYNLRKNMIILVGLWFGNTKPNMSYYLAPIIDILNSLSNIPIKWKTPDGMLRESKIFFVVSAVDSPARCMMQGHTQFNGQFGCTWCTHPGKVVKRGRGHSRVYPTQGFENSVVLRNDLDYKKQIASNDFTLGIKTASPLNLLREFDIIDGFSTDYMHCVLLGVVRSLTKLWLETVGAEYYIGNKLTEIDNNLMSVKVPYEISRTTRSIISRKHWKASEWRTWLYISPLVLKGILKNKYLRHFKKLSIGIYKLTMVKVSEQDLTFAETKISGFSMQVKSLYGEEFCTFNIHQLSHLTTCVRNWGPLWGTSAFQFESYNGKLLTYIKSSKGVQNQIGRQFVAEMQIRCYAKFQEESEASNFFSNILKLSPIRKIKYGLKRPKIVNLKQIVVRQQFKLFCNVGNIFESDYCFINYQLYNSVQKNTLKRNNSTVSISTSRLGFIQRFYHIDCKCKSFCNCHKDFVLARTFNVRPVSGLANCMFSQNDANLILEVIPLQRVGLFKFFVFNTEETTYFATIPNLFEAE